MANFPFLDALCRSTLLPLTAWSGRSTVRRVTFIDGIAEENTGEWLACATFMTPPVLPGPVRGGTTSQNCCMTTMFIPGWMAQPISVMVQSIVSV